MKKSCLSFSLLIASFLTSYSSQALADDKSKSDAQQWSQRIEFHRKEAMHKPAGEIFKMVELLRGIQSKNSSPWAMDETSSQATGYTMALEERRKAKEPAAAFYYSRYQSRICRAVEASNSQMGSFLAECWASVLDGFKIASDIGSGAASFNIGVMYEDGMGRAPSKFAAADWYVTAAHQYNKAGSRDEALGAMEAALRVVPDHPSALRLKQTLVK